MSRPIVELIQVTKTFRDRRRRVVALKEATFTVNAGDVFGLLGANGAGKTTAMRCVLGLTRPDGGTVRVLDRERPDRRTLFSQAAYLPEEPQLFAGATGREQLRYFGRLSALKRDRLKTRIDQVIELVGLQDAAHRPIKTYSKGMKQRLSIGGAILHEPRIVFLDEPTRGLDPIGRRDIRDMLQRLADDGATLFINSHLLGEVERLCNRVAILVNGEVRADGLLSELLTEDERITVRFVLPENSAIEAFPQAEHAEGGLWKQIVADTPALADLTGRIAVAGGRVIEARTQRLALEDYFIRIVREGDAS